MNIKNSFLKLAKPPSLRRLEGSLHHWTWLVMRWQLVDVAYPRRCVLSCWKVYLITRHTTPHTTLWPANVLSKCDVIFVNSALRTSLIRAVFREPDIFLGPFSPQTTPLDVLLPNCGIGHSPGNIKSGSPWEIHIELGDCSDRQWANLMTPAIPLCFDFRCVTSVVFWHCYAAQWLQTKYFSSTKSIRNTSFRLHVSSKLCEFVCRPYTTTIHWQSIIKAVKNTYLLGLFSLAVHWCLACRAVSERPCSRQYDGKIILNVDNIRTWRGGGNVAIVYLWKSFRSFTNYAYIRAV